MSFLSVKNRTGCLAGIYLVNAVVAPLPVYYAVCSFSILDCNYSTNVNASGLQLTSVEPRSGHLLLPLSVDLSQ